MPSHLSSEHTNDTLRPPPNSEAADAPVFESGIPPGGTLARTLAARGEAHTQAALTASARADANLGSLFRTVQHLAAVVSGAREAHDQVVEELDHVRTLLGQADEEQLSLQHRVVVLEQTLERTEREAARERAFLIDEQDSFIGALWDEHAAEVAEVRRRLSIVEENLRTSQDENQRLTDVAHSADLQSEDMARKLRKAEADLARVVHENAELRETLSRLQTEREEALLAASQTTRERDHLRAELGRARSSQSIRALDSADAPAASRRDSRPPEAMRVDAPGSSSSALRTDSRGALRRTDDHPEELRGALTHSDPPGAEALSPRPPTERRPDPSSRPLIGYSLAGDDVPERTLDGRPSSRPPSR